MSSHSIPVHESEVFFWLMYFKKSSLNTTSFTEVYVLPSLILLYSLSIKSYECFRVY